jgi:hypothetical protein
VTFQTSSIERRWLGSRCRTEERRRSPVARQRWLGYGGEEEVEKRAIRLLVFYDYKEFVSVSIWFLLYKLCYKRLCLK